MKKNPRTPPRVLTMGSATLDLFIDGTRPTLEELVVDADKRALLLTEGAKFEITGLKGIPGGGATNAARVLNRFGIPVTAFFKTADDQIAQTIISALRNDGIDTRPAINTSTVVTGLSIVIPAPSGNKTILNFRGANDTVEEQELPLFFMKGVNGIYVTPLAGKTADLLPKIALETRSCGARLMHNPSRHQLTKGREVFLKALPDTHILLLNLIEAKDLFSGIVLDGGKVKIAPASNLTDLQIDTHHTIFDLLETLRALGPEIVLVTNGAQGVYAADKNGFYFCPSVPTQVVNTVGAGDTFGATFFGAYLSGYKIEQALKFGTLNSAKLLGSANGFEAVLSAHELEALAKH